jgi:hypothetical protein
MISNLRLNASCLRALLDDTVGVLLVQGFFPRGCLTCVLSFETDNRWNRWRPRRYRPLRYIRPGSDRDRGGRERHVLFRPSDVSVS